MTTINGTSGADALYGTESTDTIQGFAGGDILFGLGGDDSLFAGQGDDHIAGGEGANWIDAGEGWDFVDNYELADGVVADLTTGLVSHGADTDTVLGAEGISGTRHNDTLIGDAGNNHLHGFEGTNYIDGGIGYDFTSYHNVGDAIFVDIRSNRVIHGTNIDTIMGIEAVQGTIYNDTFIGADGSETFIGLDGNNSIVGGSGFDVAHYYIETGAVVANLNTGIVHHNGFTDTVSGIEAITGGGGNDTLIGDSANNHLHGYDGANYIDGGDGTDFTTYDGLTTGIVADLAIGEVRHGGFIDTIINIEQLGGTNFADTMRGNDQDNVFVLFGGGDYVDGRGGIDLVDYYTEQDAIHADLRSGIVTYGTTTDTLVGIEQLAGTANDDFLVGNDSDNVLYGRSGNDSLFGEGGDDALIANDGFNYIDGGAGDDQLGGGIGNNTIFGGEGYDFITYFGAQDAVYIDVGLGMARDGTGIDIFYDVERFVGGQNNDTIIGASADDNFVGVDGNDSLLGAGGFDRLNGGGGNDYLGGGTGDDAISAGIGSNTINGGEGADIIRYNGVDLNNETLAGGAVYVDLMSGFATITGGVLNDTLIDVEHVLGTRLHDDTIIGNASDNLLNGIGGNDFLFGGDGNDTLTGVDNRDTLIGGTGLDWAQYIQSLPLGVYVDLSSGIAVQIGSDGLDSTDRLEGIEAVLAGNGNDTLIGDDNNNTFYGEGGNDFIDGRGGDDYLTGGDGANSFMGGDGYDIVGYEFFAGPLFVDLNQNYAMHASIDFLSDDIEQVNGTSADDTMIGGATDDNLFGQAGNDYLSGGDGDDRLVAGIGSNVLDGGTGYDVLGYGDLGTVDIYADLRAGFATHGGDRDLLAGFEEARGAQGNDTLLGTDEDNRFLGRGGMDYLAGRGGDDRLVGDDQNFYDVAADTLDGGDGCDIAVYYGPRADYEVIEQAEGRYLVTHRATGIADLLIDVEIIQFADQQVDIGGLIQFGTDGNDTLIGSVCGDTLFGLGGDDSLLGGERGDVLVGGTGSDTVSYVNSDAGVFVDLASGRATGGHAVGDTFYEIEHLTGSGHNDSLAGNLGNNILTGGDGDDTLFGNFGADTMRGGAGFDWISYEGATTGFRISLAQGHLFNADYFYDVEGIIGTDFNDELIGDARNNGFVGGLGTDILTGGLGNDQFIYGGDFATLNGDIITDMYDGDVLDLSGLGSIIYVGAGAFTGVAGQVRLSNGVLQADSDGDGIADASLTLQDVVTLTEIAPGRFQSVEPLGRIRGTPGNDTLIGGAEDNLILGYDGDDRLEGRDGNDTLHGGFGADTLDGGSGFDWISYEGADRGYVHDLTIGRLFDEYFSNVEGVIAGSFNDTLVGNAADNALVGGAGGDRLTGGAGSDRFIFRGETGHDIITDFQAGTGGDNVVLSNYGIVDYAALQSQIVQQGTNVLISFDASRSILLLNISAGDLQADNFVFV